MARDQGTFYQSASFRGTQEAQGIRAVAGESGKDARPFVERRIRGSWVSLMVRDHMLGGTWKWLSGFQKK